MPILILAGWMGRTCFTESDSLGLAPARNVQTPPPESVPGDPLRLFDTRPIGRPFVEPPRISQVQIVDLDQDGFLDVLVCDCGVDSVCWIRQQPDGTFVEQVLQERLVAPARAECVDLDRDGDLDILVAVLGKLFPSNEKIGSMVILENTGDERFQARTVMRDVARVSDLRAADLDSDGDLDLIATQFGYHEGETRWLENRGAWEFHSHSLQSLSGGIHGIPADMNGDGHEDIVSLVSQEHEAIYVFHGDGHGHFQEHKVFASPNADFGSAGIGLSDLDGDGDRDVVYCNGDAFDYSPPRPWPWHGVQWLENRGPQGFQYHRLLDLGGASGARAVDFDGDGDVDLFVSSAFHDWTTPVSQSLTLLVNGGSLRFVAHGLSNSPTHIQSIDVGDINRDGRLDMVSGGMHVSDPYDRVERVLLWLGNENMPLVER
jgi:hypothetical protein